MQRNSNLFLLRSMLHIPKNLSCGHALLSTLKPPSTYHIENAKSGRSACKKCKEVIAKGELRIVASKLVYRFFNVSLLSYGCFELYRLTLELICWCIVVFN